LVVREGDELEVGPGDFRILNRLDFIQAGFNDSDQIAFAGSFTDGSQGIFVATVTTEVPEVGIDIVPGSPNNVISLHSRGLIPVGILSSANFDAAAEVNKASLTFGRTGAEHSLKSCLPPGT